MPRKYKAKHKGNAKNNLGKYRKHKGNTKEFWGKHEAKYNGNTKEL